MVSKRVLEKPETLRHYFVPHGGTEKSREKEKRKKKKKKKMELKLDGIRCLISKWGKRSVYDVTQRPRGKGRERIPLYNDKLDGWTHHRQGVDRATPI